MFYGKRCGVLQSTACALTLAVGLMPIACAQEPSAIASQTPAPKAAQPRLLTDAEIQALIAKAAEADIANNGKQGFYTYTQTEVQHKLDGSGNATSTETKTSEVLVVAGEQVERLVSKDGKPLSAHDAAKEEEKIQKIIDKHKNESDHDREKREETLEKDRENGRKFVREIGNAYRFRHIGYQTLGGIETYVIEAEPRPDFVGHEDSAKYLNKFRMKGWIATSEPQLVKLEAEAIDTLAFGLFVARIHKGTKFTLEQTKVNNEVWLPMHIAATIDARIALFKGVRESVDVQYSDYKRFRAESKMTVVGEVVPTPEASAPKQ